MIISNRQKQTLVNMPPNPVYKCWQKKQLNVTTFALFLTLWVCFSSLSYLVYFKPVSQSRKAENMPDAVSNIFFFWIHVEKSLINSPLDIITGQLGLGSNTQLQDLHQHVDLEFPSNQRLGAVEQEALQIKLLSPRLN